MTNIVPEKWTAPSALVVPSESSTVRATADTVVGSQWDSLPVTTIRATNSWLSLNWRELWKYREVLYFLVWRDIKVRYKQTAIGAAWAILQPAATTLVFALFFGRVAQMPTSGVPYPLYALCGLLLWQFIATSVTTGSLSLVSNQTLITKIYFPRLFLPLAPVGVAAVDFTIASSLLAVALAWFEVMPGLSLLLLPVIAALTLVMVVGTSLLLSALAAYYRDVRHILPFFMQLWMFATPSIYMDARHVGPRWSLVLPLNPAYGLISAFRASVVDAPIDTYSLGLSGAVAIAMLIIGWCYFRYVERTFADVI